MSTKLDNASFKWHMIRDVPSLGYTGPGMEVPVKDEVLKHWRKEDKFQGKLILFSHIFRGLISSRGSSNCNAYIARFIKTVAEVLAGAGIQSLRMTSLPKYST